MTSENDPFYSDVVEFINTEFPGGALESFDPKEALGKLDKWEEELRRKLHPSTTEISQIVNFSEIGENTLLTLSDIIDKHENLQKELESETETFKPIYDNFVDDLQDIRKLENLHSYLLWISAIEMTNDLLEEAVKQKHNSEMLIHFGTLKQLWGKLQSSECHHLKKFSDDILLYWHEILKEKFGSEFQKALKNFHWPAFLTSPVSPMKITPDIEMKFKNLFFSLLKIQLPDEYKISTENNKLDGIEQAPFLLPFRLMFEPIEKRFYFHFMGKKLTNRIDKPQWYLYQILSWISDHESYMKDQVQPIFEEEISLYSVNAFDEFMRYLVQLAMLRLSKDLPTLLEDERLFSHTIDEIFVFERELQNLEYPKFYPTLLRVLSTEPYFMRWKSLEHKSALEKMDGLLSYANAWNSQYQEDDDVDTLRVPECAEMFIMLLLTMTERYRNCLKEDHQISFLELQLELLDDFRLRLHQLSQCQIEETIDAKYCAIVNAVNYVLIVLNEWSNLPFFLKLHTSMRNQHRLIDSDADSMAETDEKLEVSVFDYAITLFEHMQKDLINMLCERVMLGIKAKSRGYRNEKWFCMNVVQDKKLLEVSSLAYPFLDVINSSLQGLHDLLSKSLFTNVWQNIARQLDIFIYEEVILQNSFSQGGANQFHFDMTRNLFPIFGCYTIKPENYFRLVKECCTLLNLSPAPAMLLKDVLKEQNNFKEKTDALAELGVQTLSPSQSFLLLSQRNDLTT